MGKLIGLVITATAFVAALCLVLLRRRVPERRPRSLLTARYWVLVTLFVSLLGGGATSPAAAAAPAPMSEAIRAKLSDRAEWIQIRKDWLAVESLSGFGWDKMKEQVELARKGCAKQMATLISDGLVDEGAAEVFCRILAGRVYHKLRATAATCYDPTMLGAKVQAHRDDFEKRLKALAKLASDHKLKPAVIEKIRQTIARQMEFSLRVDDHWKKMPKDGPWDEYRKQEEALMAWFAKDDYKTTQLKEDLPVRPTVAWALELVQLIYRD